MLKILSAILSILPPPPKFTKKEEAMNKPKPRSLSAEPLEERLPVSSSAAGVLFGFGLLPKEPLLERSATPGYEATQTPHKDSFTQQPALIDLTLDLQLDALAVDQVLAEESPLDTITSPSADPFVLTPLTPSAILDDTRVDAHRELGNELLLFQISTLDFWRIDTTTPLQVQGGAAFHGESFWSDVSRLGARSSHDTKEYTPRVSGVIMPLEQAVREHDHDCCDHDDPMTPTRSGGNGGSGGTSGGTGNSGGNSSGGCTGKTPSYASGSGRAVIVFDANNSSDSHSFILPFDAGCSVHSPVYTISEYTSFPAICSIDGNELTVTTNGQTGYGEIIVQSHNIHGQGHDFAIEVYAYTVDGYTLWERCWGEGKDDEGWHQVEDQDKDDTHWYLLWQENEYLWQPIITPMPPADWISAITVTDTISGGIISVGAGHPDLEMLAKDPTSDNLTYESGGWGGIGYGGTSAGRFLKPGETAFPYWPFTYGTPMMTGELNISITVSILPIIKAADTTQGKYLTLLNPNNDSKKHEIVMAQTPPSAQQKRVGVTAIAGVTWETPTYYNTVNNILKVYPDGNNSKVYPEVTPDPTGTNPLKNEAVVRVTLAHAVPSGMEGTVFIALYDPLNPHGSAKTNTNGSNSGPRDNHGAASLNKTKLTYNNSVGSLHAEALLTISSAYAGDDYIVAAHPNAGMAGTYKFRDPADTSQVGATTLYYTDYNGKHRLVPGSVQSHILTVWRTLWAELDELYLVDSAGTQHNAYLPSISGFVATALAEACIEIKEYPSSLNTTTSALGVATLPGAWNPWFVRGPKDCALDCRNSPQPTNTFWTVHMIGAFWDIAGRLGSYHLNKNTIFTFNRAIVEAVDDWNTKNPNDTVSQITVRRFVSLHELGHALGLEHSEKVMTTNLDIPGIRSPDNHGFSASQIQIIQSRQKPR